MLTGFEDDPLPETRDRIRELNRLVADAEARLLALRSRAERSSRRMTIGELDEEIRKFREDCYAGDLEVKEHARSRMSMILRQLIKRIRIDAQRIAHVEVEGDRMTFDILEGKIINPVFNIRGEAWPVRPDGTMFNAGAWEAHLETSRQAVEKRIAE